MSEIVFRIRRVRPGDDHAKWQDFVVITHSGMTILEGLQQIREQQDATLSWRHSCRMGICGSCGMVVNGYPRLACNTQIQAISNTRIRLEALWNFRIAKDLVPDLFPMFEKHRDVAAHLVRKDRDSGPPERELHQTPAELDEYLQFTACIKCGVCMAACPTLANDAEFLGPMPLTAAHRYNSDSRDGGFELRKLRLGDHHSFEHCHYAAECSRACPKGVDPARAIQLMKRDLVADLLGKKRRSTAKPVAAKSARLRDALRAPPFTVDDE